MTGKGRNQNMKHTFNRLIFLLVFVFMLGSISVSAAAATTSSYAPAKVKTLKASRSSETSIKLKWNKASKATGYYIYRVKNSGELKKIATIKKASQTTYTVKNLTPKVSYTYCVVSYRTYKNKTYTADASSQVTIQTRVTTPATVQNINLKARSTTSITLTWSGAKNATGYEIYLYDSESKKYEKLATTTAKSIVVRKLKSDTPYTFAVRSYRTVKGVTVNGKYSALYKTSTASSALSAAAKAIRDAYYITKLKSSATVDNLTTGKKVKLVSGTTIIATAKTGTYVNGYVKNVNGNKVRLKRSLLRYIALDTSSKNDYSKAVKEEFVNYHGYSSTSNWLIWVSNAKGKVNIFKGSQGNWKLKQSYSCIVGAWDTRTPRGIFKILSKGRMYNDIYIPFFTNSTGTCAFHTRANMGGNFSHGCVRLTHGQLLYIKNNCPVGTTLISK